MSYQRVLPRDLFNEAKLLKCVGRLVLHIHDGFVPWPITFEDDGSPFDVQQGDDGDLFIANIHFYAGGETLVFWCQYNSRDSYTLYCDIAGSDKESVLVFDERGDYTAEFQTLFG